MLQDKFALAVNDHLDELRNRFGVPQPRGSAAIDGTDTTTPGSVAVVGLGYVGLPTALGLHSAGIRTIGVDVSGARIAAIQALDVDLLDSERVDLATALASDDFVLTTENAAVREADHVVICVPTPVDRHQMPDLGALRGACQTVVEHARAGQTIVLTSTTYVGTTRDLIIEPLTERGLIVGQDIHVAFSPERIDPGVAAHKQRETPRLVGGQTAGCAARAAAMLGRLTNLVYTVSSPEVAELAKLYENIFRAVNLALANEVAEICGTLQLDPIEVTVAAATKPYGFLACFPGPGVGGHCIPCDPHYLLWQLRKVRQPAPLIEQAMTSIANRPGRVAGRAVETLSDAGLGIRGAKVLVVGVSFKPGVQDLRGSTALEIIDHLRQRGADVSYHDPLVPALYLPDGHQVPKVVTPNGRDWDLVLMHTVHPGHDFSWAAGCPQVLDATYRFDAAPHRQVV